MFSIYLAFNFLNFKGGTCIKLTYIGCYADYISPGYACLRDLYAIGGCTGTGTTHPAGTNTIGKCATSCFNNNNKYLGVQWGW